MTKIFSYRPSLPFFLLGLMWLYVSFMLLRAWVYGEIGFAILTGFFGLSSLGLGVYFTLKFIPNFGTGDLKINEESLELPVRWGRRVTIHFRDIKNISRIDTYDKVIEIISNDGLHVIEGNWMNKKDFLELKSILANTIT